TDGRAHARGAAEGARNTPTLLDVRLQRWFGWDGANDSLWSQSIRPMLDPREMHADAAHVAAALRDDTTLRPLYLAAFGHAPPAPFARRACASSSPRRPTCTTAASPTCARR